jgi:circadian clock protein KaiB
VTAKQRPTRRGARRASGAEPPAPAGYLLRLYVTGATARSARAIANIKTVCERLLPHEYRLEIVDIYQQPELARSAQLIAAPTLLKSRPPPERRLVGDLSDQDHVIARLGLRGAKES